MHIVILQKMKCDIDERIYFLIISGNMLFDFQINNW